MNKLVIILASVLMVSTAVGTPQIEDPVAWKGTTYYPLLGPGMPWNWSPNTPRRHFDEDSTADYKGYFATWEIKKDVLYLDSFKARRHGKTVGLHQMFPGREPPIMARWFSTLIILGQGKIVGHDRDFRPVYTKELWLHFTKGKLIKVEERTSDISRVVYPARHA